MPRPLGRAPNPDPIPTMSLAMYLAGREALALPVLAGLLLSAASLALYFRARRRAEADDRRITLLDRALRSGSLDDATRRELLAVLRAEGRRQHGAGAFAFGWVLLMAGLGMLAATIADHDWLVPGVLTAAVGFGILSVPIARRELHHRSLHASHSD